MIDRLPDPRKILEETDWAVHENYKGSAHPRTPMMLLGLTSGDLPTTEAGLSHITNELIEYPNVYSAAVPAAKYIAALLVNPPSPDSLKPSWDTGKRRPLRAKLLAWLSTLIDSVGDVREREFIDLAGYSPLEYPDSTFRKIREIRPQIFIGVAACLEDQDPVVREEALAAAALCVEAPELASYRQALGPSIREVLAVSPNPTYRRWAVKAIEAWGENDAHA